MLEKIFGPYKDYSFLVLRLGVGSVFIGYGTIKFYGGLGSVASYFAQLGIPLPGIMAPVVAATEFFGGLAIVLGISTRLAAILLSAVMLVAMATATLAMGFAGGYDLNLALLAGLLCLLLAGPGKPAIGGDL
ncbi:MAG: DoxX family protein [Candidatus Binatia bacterium]